ncbi:MAG TPA: bifunctional phosphoribosyl-AMP cyclohydrolase/phosphoribosyl-ATP diphosphatase HisIE [Flavipsychrobacter sp.]|nr:bifunctional phosphoribosyl-AMP cyclohydrolase/phosphoribosyl-ATP diphosphatase HisIE [Flavipsychrobacter sp.]
MTLDFAKNVDRLVPAIIQDSETGKILMLGYMNEEAYLRTIADGKVTFYSRSKKSLWLKGETSGNFLNVIEILNDCDNDCLLIKVDPTGPVCHTGTDTCFGEKNQSLSFLPLLEKTINDRRNNPLDTSYTSSLFKKGINKIAQKVGEEAIELVIESKDNNIDLFKNEAADLLFHFLILLREKELQLSDIEEVLKQRYKK